MTYIMMQDASGRKFEVHLRPIIFSHYVAPMGFLDRNLETHALWYYYLAARGTYETHVKDIIVLETDKDPVADFRNLFKSIARMYQVSTENMRNAWPQVDMQCTALHLPKLPERYR